MRAGRAARNDVQTDWRGHLQNTKKLIFLHSPGEPRTRVPLIEPTLLRTASDRIVREVLERSQTRVGCLQSTTRDEHGKRMTPTRAGKHGRQDNNPGLSLGQLSRSIQSLQVRG